MDDGIKALFLTASAIHFGLRPAASVGAGRSTSAHRLQAQDALPEEVSFCAHLYRRIHGRRNRKQRGSDQLRQWSLMPGN
jgi:hypothetical protein